MYKQLATAPRPAPWQVKVITEDSPPGSYSQPFNYSVAFTTPENARRTADFLAGRQSFKGLGWLINRMWVDNMVNRKKLTPQKVARSITRSASQGSPYVMFQTEGGGYPWHPSATPWSG